MSTYIENNHHNNISQYLSTCEAPKGFSAGQILKKAKFWANRSRQRRQLARLDAHMLEDIGLTVEQVREEMAKPFWK
jgi:uncharacterized protein YjiS (DUF1127 family)